MILRKLNCAIFEYLILPYTPTRITKYSATCIDHVFVKLSKRTAPCIVISLQEYCTLTLMIISHTLCHWNALIISTCKTKSSTLWIRKLSKICREDVFSAVGCSIYKNVDWYTAFINCVKSFYEQRFSWVTVSRKRIKDTKYLVSLCNNNTSAIIKYKRYNDLLRIFINEAETAS